MQRYLIERNLPNVGDFKPEQFRAAACRSNEVIGALGTGVQWVQSFVAADKMFCVYLAEDEGIIRRHAEISGFPADRITTIGRVIDPTTGAP